MPHSVGEEIGMIKITAYLGWDPIQHQSMYEVRCMSCNRECMIRGDQLSKYGERGCPDCRGSRQIQMKVKDDLTGYQVKGYTVERLLPERDKNRRRQWLCRCNICGERKVFNQYDIKQGRMRNCECVRRRAFLSGKKRVSREMIESM